MRAQNIAPLQFATRDSHSKIRKESIMARATQGRSSDTPRDAVTLLKQDHRTVESLFGDFADADESEQAAIAERVCQLLTVHAQIEEEILYPAAKQALQDEEDAELVSEALVEHGSAKELIGKIEGMTGDDQAFKATVTVLGEYIKHHVKEEENELFPALKKTELDLKELGARMAERKHALMEQMGIEAEEEGSQRERAATSRARPRAAHGRSSRKSSRTGSHGRTARH
jgi:hemerythrin-like domain-containing protein